MSLLAYKHVGNSTCTVVTSKSTNGDSTYVVLVIIVATGIKLSPTKLTSLDSYTHHMMSSGPPLRYHDYP